VQTKDFLRKLTIGQKSKIVFVSFLGTKEELKPGYSVKGKVDKEIIKSLHITLPVTQKLNISPEMYKMSVAELYKKSDMNEDGAVSYVEFSSVIYRSDKHGPDTFAKNDLDKSGTFDLKEFAAKLSSVVWWRLSRNTPEQWLKKADKNNDGKIGVEEFNTIADSGNHYKDRFRKWDKDKSGSLSLKEVSNYINSVLKPKKK
jgi:Ca2+-binding EF-hand superfamily protein